MARGPRVYTRAVRLAEATSAKDTLSPSEGTQLVASLLLMTRGKAKRWAFSPVQASWAWDPSCAPGWSPRHCSEEKA